MSLFLAVTITVTVLSLGGLLIGLLLLLETAAVDAVSIALDDERGRSL